MGAPLRVVFRVDASRTIGHGHVARCSVLAAALRERGADIRFVCREYDGHLCDELEAQRFTVSRLPAAEGGWEHDAAETMAMVVGCSEPGAVVDWLVVDHYGLGLGWERTLRPVARRTMVIDDFEDRDHDCDILLNQNIMDEVRDQHRKRVADDCVTLFGPRYALLQPAYAELHAQVAPRIGPVRRIFVFFGGADRADLTGRALAAIGRLNRSDVAVDVVVASDAPTLARIRALASEIGGVTVHERRKTLAPLMAAADLALGAGGVTSWERLCVGLPSLIVTLAENQVPVARALHVRGLARWLGDHTTVTETAIADTLREILDEGLDEEWSSHCLATVDGRGAQRVCAAFTTTAATPLHTRPAAAADEDLLLEWANDPVTRRNGFSPNPIVASEHRAWFQRRLHNPANCRIKVVETDDHVPVGQVRFERADGRWEVHYSVGPAFRGRGLGRQVLAVALEAFRQESPGVDVFGRVKTANHASRRIFVALGFEERAVGPDEYVYWS